MIKYNKNYPNFIKYMGSKTNILDFVMEGINKAYIPGSTIVDLFAGSATLACALRGQTPVISNDIQEYSSVLTDAYLSDYDWDSKPDLIDNIILEATIKYEELIQKFGIDIEGLKYHNEMTMDKFIELEELQKSFIDKENWGPDNHLFSRYYAGTYWSYEQCVWIDAYKSVADEYEGSSIKSAILASLMFAMSYNAQSTGHYAQYRDATSEESMKDILIYRQKEITPYIRRKLIEMRDTMASLNNYQYKALALDFRECLKVIPRNSTVYADPPYCFVHYSRFYHAIETLVRYDYPEVKFKGRYRTDRHQSPFCIKTKVSEAFEEMFTLVSKKESNLVLSYSNTGMITIEEINQIAEKTMKGYQFELLTMDHKHSTMGRRVDKFKDVQEALIIIKKEGEC